MAPTSVDAQPRESSSATHSETQSQTPRAALITVLANAVHDAAASGDIAAARIVVDALGLLLAEPGSAVLGAEVVSITDRRQRDSG